MTNEFFGDDHKLGRLVEIISRYYTDGGMPT